jgi:cytosine/adenosine deaminase-related metal-dependent hydrolase
MRNAECGSRTALHYEFRTPNSAFRAAWVVPVDRPPIPNAVVTTRDGRIDRIIAANDVPADGYTDLGRVILMPGLINAHTHLELTNYHGKIPPMPFWTWLDRLIALRAAAGPQAEREAVERGAHLSLAAGVTLLGDISRTHQAWPVLAATEPAKVCFAELLSFAARPARTPEELTQQVDTTETSARLIVGVSPHAPYTVQPAHLRAACELARQRRLPITMHLAETREEVEFCTHGTGVVTELLDRFGQTDHIPSPRTTPAVYVRGMFPPEMPLLVAHGNYLDDASIAILAQTSWSVVFCPRTHRYFGHDPHPFRRLIDAGVNVAVGTDSAASLPTDDGYAPLSVLDEIRFLHAEHPDVPAATLLDMITRNAARALSMADVAGSITPGKWADLIAVPIDAQGPDDPIRNILTSNAPPAYTIVQGRIVAGAA